MATIHSWQKTEKKLRKLFADSLEKGVSGSAISVSFISRGYTRFAIGVPYSISDNNLEIGPYFKNDIAAPPSDYQQRKMQIPLYNIIDFRRIELSDIL